MTEARGTGATAPRGTTVTASPGEAVTPPHGDTPAARPSLATAPPPGEAPAEATATFSVPADHPCLPGHFPGRPVVPGVVLLDRVFAAAARAGLPPPARIAAAKFTRPVLPEEKVSLALRRTSGGRVAFAGTCGEARAFSGEYEP